MASLVPGKKQEQEQGQEQEQEQQWAVSFKKEVKASDLASILEWYSKSNDPVKNPSYLIGLDDEGKKRFEYIIEGIISSIEEGPEKAIKVKNIVDNLKKYYIDLPESDNELVLIDLLIKVSAEVPTLKLKTSFSKFLPDFHYHIPEGYLNTIDFFDFCGVSTPDNLLSLLPSASLQQMPMEPVNPLKFLMKIKEVLSEKKLTELENLADIHEDDVLNLRYKFKYNLKRTALANNITVCIIEHLIDNYDKYAENAGVIADKTSKLKKTMLLLYEEFYTIINSSGLSAPIGLFLDFYNMDYSVSTGPNNSMMRDESVSHKVDSTKNELFILYWYFKKIVRILEHSEISEFKKQESLYDLFDLIELDDIHISENREATIMSDKYPFSNSHTVNAESSNNVYPLRTIHFRKDFIINVRKNIKIEDIDVPPAFWLAIDKNICWVKKLPFSYFHGIISSDDIMLEPLYHMLVNEVAFLSSSNSSSNSSSKAHIFDVIDKIATKIASKEPRCTAKQDLNSIITDIEAAEANDGYDLKDKPFTELNAQNLLFASANCLVYAANMRASYITQNAVAQKLENMAEVYLNQSIKKAIETGDFNKTITQCFADGKIDKTGANAVLFITSAYYNYFNNEIRYSIDVASELYVLFALLSQTPALAKAEIDNSVPV